MSSKREEELKDRLALLEGRPLPSAQDILRRGQATLRARTAAETAALDKASHAAFAKLRQKSMQMERQMKKGRKEGEGLLKKLEEHTKRIEEALPGSRAAPVSKLVERYTKGMKQMRKHIEKYVATSPDKVLLTTKERSMNKRLNEGQQKIIAAFKAAKEAAEKVGDIPKHPEQHGINAWIEHLSTPRAAVVGQASSHRGTARVVGATGGESKATGGARRTRRHKRKRRRKTRRRRKKRKTRRRLKKRHRRTRTK